MRRAVAFVFALAAFLIFAAPIAAHAGSVPTANIQESAAVAQEPTPPAQDPEEHAEVQEGAELAGVELHGEEGEPKPWFYWPAKWFNFIALCGLLYWMLVIPPVPIQDIFSFPGLKVILADRAVAIIAARDLAAQQRDGAASILTESEQRLDKIEDELEALVAEARGDADHEKDRAFEDGKLQSAKILEVAEREVNNEAVTAHRQLRGFVADLAVNMAQKSLSEHLTAEDQDRLIRDYLSRLGQSVA